jgi:hypothetical protein
VAVERGGGVEFYDFDGNRVASAPGFTIYNFTTPPSHLVLERDGVYYDLEEFRDVLVPLGSQREADRRIGDDPEVHLPPPKYHGRPAAGHWRFAVESPRYAGRLLAQWSGECEVPTAYFVEPDEHEIEPVTGEEDISKAPESFALGWTFLGRAVVFLPQGACGSSTDPPGVYLFRGPGRGQLLVETPAGGAARMWGNTVAD